MTHGYPTIAGAPLCGLYLIVDKMRDSGALVKELREIFLCINASTYEKNMHVVEYRPVTPEIADAELASRLGTLCRASGIVFLCHNDISFAAKALADGVMLDDGEAIDTAREVFGPEGIVGLRCGNSMVKAEAGLARGIDIASFYSEQGRLPDPSLLRRWHTRTENPCLAEGPLTNDHCDFYVTAGADFIDSSHYIRTHAQGVKQGTVNMLYAIDLALEHRARTAKETPT